MRADVDIWGWIEETPSVESDPLESRSGRTSRLQLLMHERETTAGRLMEIDYAIWVLEESFRAGS